MDNMDADYRAIPELDRYDPELLDEAEQDELDYAERQRVEAILAERDEREGRARQRGCVRACALRCVGLSSVGFRCLWFPWANWSVRFTIECAGRGTPR